MTITTGPLPRPPAWGQGPVLLQSLARLKGFDLSAMDPAGPDFVHVVVEAMKLAFADREVYYGDPNFAQIPTEYLLSEGYNAVAPQADRQPSLARTAARPRAGYDHQFDLTVGMLAEVSGKGAVYEPTMSHLTEKRGDTVHIDVIDRWGNMVSTTPSGGWLQSSPIVPGLGFALNSRAQMFWLKPGLPTSLEPGKRPRTTLTPVAGPA
jgi:gamma-glutamyltranspeptidase/glutathione hydrolase